MLEAANWSRAGASFLRSGRDDGARLGLLLFLCCMYCCTSCHCGACSFLVAQVGDGDAAAAGARVGVAVLPPADTYVVMYGI